MKIIYLIGGTGNQLFQLSHLKKGDDYSTLLLTSIARRLLKQTNHINIVNESIKFKHFLLLPLVFFDLFLLKFFSFTLFSRFDINYGSSRPLLLNLIWIGYFQDFIGDNSNLIDFFSLPKLTNSNFESTISVHVRAGDIFQIDQNKNPNGVLASTYYVKSLELIKDFSVHDYKIKIFSDNVEYAKIIKNVYLKAGYTSDIVDVDLLTMINTCVNSTHFIASNSTLSYWISILRKGDRTIVPSPFLKKKILPDPFNFLSVDVEY